MLVAVVFTLATLIGLWVLNQTPSDPGVIFSGAGATSMDSATHHAASLPRATP